MFYIYIIDFCNHCLLVVDMMNYKYLCTPENKPLNQRSTLIEVERQRDS